MLHLVIPKARESAGTMGGGSGLGNSFAPVPPPALALDR